MKYAIEPDSIVRCLGKWACFLLIVIHFKSHYTRGRTDPKLLLLPSASLKWIGLGKKFERIWSNWSKESSFQGYLLWAWAMSFRNRVSSNQFDEIRANFFSKAYSLNTIRERQQKFGIFNRTGWNIGLIQSVVSDIVNDFQKSCQNLEGNERYSVDHVLWPAGG